MKNIFQQKFLDEYPNWMALQDKRDPLYQVYERLGMHCLHSDLSWEKNKNRMYPYLSDVEEDAYYYSYALISGEVGANSRISGSYDTPVSGDIGIIQFYYDTGEEYYPTRATALGYDELPISGLVSGLCYIDDVPSGSFLIGWVGDSAVYTLTDQYEVCYSGAYCRATAEFMLEFQPVSGELYRADLYNVPMSYSFEDIYGENPLSGLYVDGQYAYVTSEYLNSLGKVLATVEYSLCDWPYRIKTDQFRFGHFYETVQPDILLAKEIELSGCSDVEDVCDYDTSGVYLTWRNIPFEFSSTVSGSYLLLRCSPYDILPGDLGRVDVAYTEYTHAEIHSSRICHIFDDNVIGESVRCFIDTDNGSVPVYYMVANGEIFSSYVAGTVPIYPVSFSGEYYPNDIYVYVPSEDDYHITYYTNESKTYYVRGESSHKVYPTVDYRWNDDYRLVDDVVFPSTILQVRECDSDLNHTIVNSLRDNITVYAPLYYCGTAYDLTRDGFIFMNHRGLMESENGTKWYLRYPDQKTLTAILNERSPQTIGGRSAELKELQCFEPNYDITYRSMTNYQNHLLILGEYGGGVYVLVMDALNIPDILNVVEVTNLDGI